MADLKTTLIIFPVFVMFMVTIVQVGAFAGSSSEDFLFFREEDNTVIAAIDTYTQSAYDNFGEDPRKDWVIGGGDWSPNERNEWADTVISYMDNSYSVEEGHNNIAANLIGRMETRYDNDQTRVDENDIRYYVTMDASALLEWEELNAAHFSFSDSLIFLGLLFGVIALVGIIGIRIFGIGLAETSISTIFTLTTLLLLWGILSIVASTYLHSIPVIGDIFWILLTFMYLGGTLLMVMED